MSLFNKIKELFNKPIIETNQPTETAIDVKPISRNENNNDKVCFINVFESYKIKTPNLPIEISNGAYNYITSREESIFTEHLTNEMKKIFPDATIKLSLRHPFIINYELYGNCQICRFQYSRYGHQLQIIKSKGVDWISLYDLDTALNAIPKILAYAKSLSSYHLNYRDTIYQKNYSYDDYYINMYFDCCYSVIPSDDKRRIHVSSADRQQYINYKNRLGDDCPSTLSEFLSIKYNYPEDWESLKSVYRKKVK